MKKKTSLTIGVILLLLAVCFFKYTASHPEAVFPWDNVTTFTLYGAYIWLLMTFLLDIPFWKEKRLAQPGNILIKIIVYSLLAVTQLINKPAEPGFIAICRGFVIFGGREIALENLILLITRRADISD